jgi:hypothetical protein
MIELQTSVKQDDTTRTRTPKPGYIRNLISETRNVNTHEYYNYER